MPVSTTIDRTRLPIPSNPQTSFRAPVKPLMIDAVKRRTDPDKASVVKTSHTRCKPSRKPLAEKDLNVELVKVEVEDDEPTDEEILKLLQRLRSKPRKQPKTPTKPRVTSRIEAPAAPVEKPKPSSAVVIHVDDSLLAQALARPAPPIPQTPPRVRTSVPNQSILRAPTKYDATRPKFPSPLSPSASTHTPPLSLSQRFLDHPPPSVTSRKLRKCQNQHHGYSKSSLATVRSLWEVRYEDWVHKRLNIRRRASSNASSSSEATTSDLNPDIFPRVGNLSTLHSSGKGTESEGTEIDWFFGRCSLSSISRTLYLFDLNQILSTIASGDKVKGSAQLDRPWETDWEIRWQVLGAILQRHQEGENEESVEGGAEQVRQYHDGTEQMNEWFDDEDDGPGN